MLIEIFFYSITCILFGILIEQIRRSLWDKNQLVFSSVVYIALPFLFAALFSLRSPTSVQHALRQGESFGGIALVDPTRVMPLEFTADNITIKGVPPPTPSSNETIADSTIINGPLPESFYLSNGVCTRSAVRRGHVIETRVPVSMCNKP